VTGEDRLQRLEPRYPADEDDEADAVVEADADDEGVEDDELLTPVDGVSEAELLEYDESEDDVEAEVAELLGETPPRPVAEFDHSRLFQEAADTATEQERPTD